MQHQQVKKLEPRRKFNMRAEISLALTRFRHQNSDTWNFIPDRRVLKQILEFKEKRYLYVNGLKEIEVYLSRHEVLKYASMLDLPTYKSPTGKKIGSTPLFKKTHMCCSLPLNPPKIRRDQLKQFYLHQEAEHKRLENHHPDGIGWAGGVIATMECVFDVFNCLLRTQRIDKAFKNLLEILAGDKFANLDSAGILYALIHISIRGVDMDSEIFDHSEWRRKPITQERIFEELANIERGVYNQEICEDYYQETYLHMRAITNCMTELRVRSTHDITKFQPDMFYAYVAWWGLYQRFSDANKYRFDSGIYSVAPVEIGNPTMFRSIGASLLEGAKDSAEFTEAVHAVHKLPREMESIIAHEGDEILSKLDIMSEKKIDRIEKLASEFLANVRDIASETREGLVSDANGIVKTAMDQLPQIFSPALSILESLKGMIDEKLAFVQDVASNFFGTEISLKSVDIFSAVQAYVMYINVESSILKSFFVFKILLSLGVTQVIMAETMRLWGILVSGVADMVARPTSDLLSWAIDTPINVFKILGGIIVSTISKVPLSASKFLTLAKEIGEKMKAFHFIGSGMNGVSKIIEHGKAFFNFISEWISVNIFGKTPERQELIREMLSLMVRIRYFDTEVGLSAIRLSENMRKQAEALMPKMQSLLTKLREKVEYRQMYSDLDRLYRPCKAITDFVSRLRAASNFQPTMFHVQFVGRPGVGKSTIIKNVSEDVCRSIWRESSEGNVYAYNTNLEYFDGYNKQKIFYIDDIYKIQDPAHLTTSMFLVTNTPVILPMANLNDKGIQLESEVMLSTTNTAYPVGKDILCIEAVHRRRHMLLETVIDEEVLDPSLGQFEFARYIRKYKASNCVSGEGPCSLIRSQICANCEQRFKSLPHLKFNLLRPVPREMSGAETMTTSSEAHQVLQDYAQKLEAENFKIYTAKGEVDPTFYFSENNKPPQGIQLPCSGWTYEQMISNVILRYKNFRATENTYNSQQKFQHVELCLAEIDGLLGAQNQIKETNKIKFRLSPTPGKVDKKVMEQFLCSMQHPFGTEDEIGRASANGIDLPELRDIDFEKLVDDVLRESGATSDSEPSTSSSASFEIIMDPNGHEDEEVRRLRILREKNKNVRNYHLENMLNVEKIDNKYAIEMIPHFTMWENWKDSDMNVNESLKLRLSAWAQMHKNGHTISTRLVDEYLQAWNEGGKLTKAKIVAKLTAETIGMAFWEMAQFRENVAQAWWGQTLVYPDNDKIIPELRGQDSGLPIWMLRKIFKKDARWYLDISRLHHEKNQYGTVEVETASGDKFRIPEDMAFVFSGSSSLQLFFNCWDDWPETMREEVLREAHWRGMWTADYSYEKLAADCQNIFKKYYYKGISYITRPIRYMVENFPIFTTISTAILAMQIISFLLNSLAQLMCPNPTSKYLHRGPQSNLVYHGRQTSSDVGGISQLVGPLLNKNVRQIEVVSSAGRSGATALFSEQFMILNKHVIEDIVDDEFELRIYLYTELDPVSYFIPRKNILIADNGDLALVYSQMWPSFRKIEHHFLTDKIWSEIDHPQEAAFLSHSRTGTELRVYQGLRKIVDLYLKSSTTTCTISRAFMFSGSTIGGKSGSTVLTRVQGLPKILGIQAWEVDVIISPKIAVQVITQEMFLELKAKLLQKLSVVPVVREEGEHLYMEGNVTSAFEEVPEDALEYKCEEKIGLVGQNQIKPSILFNELPNYGITTNRTPAVLNPGDRRLYHKRSIHPLANSLGKYFRSNILPFDIGLLNKVESDITQYKMSKLDKLEFRFLDFEEAIIGTREDGSNPMNLKTSPGIPFVFQNNMQKGKQSFLRIDEFGDLSFVDDSFLAQYNEFEEKLKNRVVPNTRAYDFPKDELRPIVKALGSEGSPPKTRTVTCMNMNYVIAWRKATLDYWAAMHRAADGTFPFCPGINPEGPDWNNAFHYLNKFSNAVDFDVSNWDGFLRSDLIYAVGNSIKKIVKNKDTNAIVDSILFEVMNSAIQYEDTVYRKSRGMVSGFPGTAEINSESHWFLLYYIYLLLAPPYARTYAYFHANVALLVYGDDIIITFSDKIKEWFCGTKIRDVYLAIGYPVTAADKNGEICDSKPLLQCKFLKSTWREYLPYYYIRKMDLEIAYDLVLWTRAKQNPVVQFYENYIDALRIVFGHGRQVFDEFNVRIQRALVDKGYDPLGYTYDDFDLDYRTRYNLL